MNKLQRILDELKTSKVIPAAKGTMFFEGVLFAIKYIEEKMK